MAISVTGLAFFGLDFVTKLGVGSAQQFYPYNAELLHGIAAMAFGRDVLSPLLNIGWGVLAALAAWCIGRSRGAAPLALLGLMVVVGLPSLTGTQPGRRGGQGVACVPPSSSTKASKPVSVASRSATSTPS